MHNLWVIYELIPAPFKRKKRKLRQELEKPIFLIYRALNFRGALLIISTVRIPQSYPLKISMFMRLAFPWSWFPMKSIHDCMQ